MNTIPTLRFSSIEDFLENIKEEKQRNNKPFMDFVFYERDSISRVQFSYCNRVTYSVKYDSYIAYCCVILNSHSLTSIMSFESIQEDVTKNIKESEALMETQLKIFTTVGQKVKKGCWISEEIKPKYK